MIFNTQVQGSGGGGATLTYQKQTDATLTTTPNLIRIPNVDKLPQAVIVDATGGSAFPWLQ